MTYATVMIGAPEHRLRLAAGDADNQHEERRSPKPRPAGYSTERNWSELFGDDLKKQPGRRTNMSASTLAFSQENL
jgi:hypothetical protein